MLNALRIKNFRNLEHLEIRQLGRVNLIVGSNNIGKSSLLEALRILAGGASSRLLRDLLQYRDELFYMAGEAEEEGDFLPLENLFSGRKFPEDDTQIFIGDPEQSAHQIQMQFGVLGIDVMQDATGLNLPASVRQKFIPMPDCASAEFDEAEFALRISKNGMAHIVSGSRMEAARMRERRLAGALPTTPCAWISSKTLSLDELAEIWDRVWLNPEHKESIAQALRIIAPEFRDLLFVQDPKRARPGRIPMVSLEGQSRPFPLNSMGDGMARVLQLAMKIFAARGGMLLIDEFENGLYYKIQRQVWEMLFDLAQALDVQIFATTHSFDCVNHFAAVAQNRPETGAMLLKLGRSILPEQNGAIVAIEMDAPKLAAMTDAEIEVR
ncbi:AAA family ATPase [Massilia sp. W12]|uniref:AAA family ATPase n=1 Tax=Massilia sp. W12 TaxID=3126507 RepID=UPI0030D37F91